MSYRFYTALRRSIILPDCIHGGRIKGVCGALFVFLLSDCFISAATVSLEGTVTTGAGVGIAGASVTLAKEKTLSAKTDAQGAFTLSGETGVGVDRSPLFGKPQFPFALSGNRLVITPAFETADGRVEIFSHDGRRSAAVVYRGSKAGKRTVGLPEFASGLTIIRITIGKESFTRTLIRVGDGVDYSGRDTRLTGRSGEFTLTGQASAAAVDTLIAAKSGFTEVKTPIDSYEKKGIAIVMQEDGPVGEMSLVYDKEFTGEDCPKPALVADPTALPSIDCLPDPFLNADGSRITKKAEWRCRRAEIKAILEKYDAGEKPAKPEKFEATLSGNTVTIQCGVGSNSITLTASISRPRNATDPCPAIIGINAATGSLPSDIFSSRGIAAITFTSSQIMGDGMFSSAPRNSGNFYKLYPQTTAGSMIRWAWGVSRIIDALEVLPEAKIDTRRLAVSGCSYQGKIALFAGAWDERIALTIPHESGGGGTISWRYSDMLEDRDNTEVENLHHAQGCEWYAEVLKKYVPKNVSPATLPYDHHELIGMIAPRAVLCIESSNIARMGAEAARVDALAARRIWKALGVPDRMGATEENIGHCSWHNGFTADLEAYVDKFLLGKTNVNTDILRSRFTGVDTATWIPWAAPALQ